MKTAEEAKMKTKIPKNLKVGDMMNAKGVTASTRFAIWADSNAYGIRTIIGLCQYKPHAELFVKAIQQLEARRAI